MLGFFNPSALGWAQSKGQGQGMAEVTNELIYEVLKQIQADIAELKAANLRHDEQFKSVRHTLVAMQGNDLHHEATMAGVRADVDTIKRRLNLSDA